MSRVTINDIAKKMNVSANTVSKALNGKAKVSEKLRKRIIATATSMGYEKNINASRLSQKPIKIGVLVNGYNKNYYSYILCGLKEASEFLADRHVDTQIKVVEASRDDYEALKILREFADNSFDGVIISDVNSSHVSPILKEYEAKRIKYAFLNYDIPGTNRSFAMINDYSCAAGLAAEILNQSVGADEELAVYSIADSYTQRKLAENFIRISAELGRKNIRQTSDEEELFSWSNIGGIYVSHASYINICRKLCEPDRKMPKLVVSDLYRDAIPFLENGTIAAIIYQNPVKQAFLTVVDLYELISGGKKCDDVMTVAPLIVMRSNYKRYL